MTTHSKPTARTSRSPAPPAALAVAVAVAATLAGTGCRRAQSPDPELDAGYLDLSFTTADGEIDSWRIPLPSGGSPLESAEVERFLAGRSGSVAMSVVQGQRPTLFIGADIAGGFAHGTARTYAATADGRRELISSARYFSGVRHGEESIFNRTEPRGLWATETRLWEAGTHAKTTINYPDGQPLVTFELVDGKRDGPATVRHPDGSEAFTGSFRAGAPYDGTFLTDDPLPPELAEAAFHARTADGLPARRLSAGQPGPGPKPEPERDREPKTIRLRPDQPPT